MDINAACDHESDPLSAPVKLGNKAGVESDSNVNFSQAIKQHHGEAEVNELSHKVT